MNFQWFNQAESETVFWLCSEPVNKSVQCSVPSLLSVASSIQRPASSVQRPASSVQSPVSRVQSLASKVQRTKSSVQSPASSVQRPGSSVQSPESRVQHPESRVQHLRSEPSNCGMPIEYGSRFQYGKCNAKKHVAKLLQHKQSFSWLQNFGILRLLNCDVKLSYKFS